MDEFLEESRQLFALENISSIPGDSGNCEERCVDIKSCSKPVKWTKRGRFLSLGYPVADGSSMLVRSPPHTTRCVVAASIIDSSLAFIPSATAVGEHPCKAIE